MQQAIRRLPNFAARCALIVTVSSLALAVSPQGTLRIKLDHLRNGNGQVGCALFASERGFPKEEQQASQRKLCPISNNQGQCAFEPIAPGTYAVVCFHDENGNGQLDTGFWGSRPKVLPLQQCARIHGPAQMGRRPFSYAPR